MSFLLVKDYLLANNQGQRILENEKSICNRFNNYFLASQMPYQKSFYSAQVQFLALVDQTHITKDQDS
jgi:hypothetical protein